jgi:hypothetical protein
MSSSTAVGLVSESLQNLLVNEMKITPEVPVTILAPDEAAGKTRALNLFLYKVKENSTLKNLDWQVKRGGPKRLVPPPLSLNLFYLMTAYAANDALTGNSNAQDVLGEAMRVFYENPIIPSEYLADKLQDSREQLKIIMNTLDLDELSKIWSTFTQPFRLSVLYEVSVVQLDMKSGREVDMGKRVTKIGSPREAPFNPPVVLSLEPSQGPAASQISFHGSNLSGWKAYVTVLGRRLADALDISGDSFKITIPPDLPPGFHEIRVDISHLFRRTFFFEVTS